MTTLATAPAHTTAPARTVVRPGIVPAPGAKQWVPACDVHCEASANWSEKSVSPESLAMSKALKKEGFVFVGPTTMYALMQAIGLVDDHLVGCHRRGSATAR